MICVFSVVCICNVFAFCSFGICVKENEIDTDNKIYGN